MALAPKLAGTVLPLGLNPPKVKHTLELYLDYVCPFSAKMFNTFYNHVLPRISKSQHYTENLQVILRPQIQPWHPSSTLTVESGLAVLQLAPDKFWQYSAALFEKQKEYFDIPLVNEARNDTYKRLCKLAGTSVGIDEAKMFDLLKIPEQGSEGNLNVGNAVTNDVKRTVKMTRLTGIHVTPTITFDGLVEGSISSSMTADQWMEWFEKNAT